MTISIVHLPMGDSNSTVPRVDTTNFRGVVLAKCGGIVPQVFAFVHKKSARIHHYNLKLHRLRRRLLPPDIDGYSPLSLGLKADR